MQSKIEMAAQHIYNELIDSPWGIHRKYDLGFYVWTFNCFTDSEIDEIVEEILKLMEDSRLNWANLPEDSLTRELNDVFEIFSVDGYFETPNKIYMYCGEEIIHDHKELDGLYQILECIKGMCKSGNYQATDIDIKCGEHGGYHAHVSLKQL